jgi:hypothetical protein
VSENVRVDFSRLEISRLGRTLKQVYDLLDELDWGLNVSLLSRKSGPQAF